MINKTTEIIKTTEESVGMFPIEVLAFLFLGVLALVMVLIILWEWFKFSQGGAIRP